MAKHFRQPGGRLPAGLPEVLCHEDPPRSFWRLCGWVSGCGPALKGRQRRPKSHQFTAVGMPGGQRRGGFTRTPEVSG